MCLPFGTSIAQKASHDPITDKEGRVHQRARCEAPRPQDHWRHCLQLLRCIRFSLARGTRLSCEGLHQLAERRVVHAYRGIKERMSRRCSSDHPCVASSILACRLRHICQPAHEHLDQNRAASSAINSLSYATVNFEIMSSCLSPLMLNTLHHELYVDIRNASQSHPFDSSTNSGL